MSYRGDDANAVGQFLIDDINRHAGGSVSPNPLPASFRGQPRLVRRIQCAKNLFRFYSTDFHLLDRMSDQLDLVESQDGDSKRQ
jgi:hypothetical protein